jgi:hypothetical protein
MLSRPIDKLTQPLRVDSALARPLQAQRNHGAEQLLGSFRMPDRIVVEKQDAAGSERFDGLQVVDHLTNWAGAEAALVVRLHGAVLTRVGAAAREDHGPVKVHAVQPARLEGFVLEQGERGVLDARQFAEVVPRGGSVDAAAAAGGEVGQHIGPHELGLAGDDSIGVLERFLRRQRHPGAAKHDPAAAAAKVVCKIVCPLDLRPHGGDPDDVAVLLEVDVVE